MCPTPSLKIFDFDDIQIVIFFAVRFLFFPLLILLIYLFLMFLHVHCAFSLSRNLLVSPVFLRFPPAFSTSVALPTRPYFFSLLTQWISLSFEYEAELEPHLAVVCAF